MHYDTEKDIIAIKFYCCQKYYPCYQCHDEGEDHAIIPWPADCLEATAILCGVCQREMRIIEYMNSGAACPYCQSAFNPKCANHYDIYFQLPKGEKGGNSGSL